MTPEEREQLKAWVDNWKAVGPKLQQIRDEELRQLSNKGIREAAGHVVYEAAPHRNGMVTMQAWFMRFHMLQLLAKQKQEQEPIRDH